MRLLGSLVPELARPVGAGLVVFAAWAVLDRTVLTQAPAPSAPAAGTPAPQAPPGGGRAGDGGRGGARGELSPFAKTALAVRWESARLNDIPNAFPITYMVDAKQDIAMPVGNPGLQGNAALRTAPEHGAVRGASSSMLWVWQLP
jgi:hypothetical protein